MLNLHVNNTEEHQENAELLENWAKCPVHFSELEYLASEMILKMPEAFLISVDFVVSDYMLYRVEKVLV